MAQLIVIVEIEDKTAEEVYREARSIDGMPMDDPISAWDLLALLWGGDLDHLKAKAVVDMALND